MQELRELTLAGDALDGELHGAAGALGDLGLGGQPSCFRDLLRGEKPNSDGISVDFSLLRDERLPRDEAFDNLLYDIPGDSFGGDLLERLLEREGDCAKQCE